MPQLGLPSWKVSHHVLARQFKARCLTAFTDHFQIDSFYDGVAARVLCVDKSLQVVRILRTYGSDRQQACARYQRGEHYLMHEPCIYVRRFFEDVYVRS